MKFIKLSSSLFLMVVWFCSAKNFGPDITPTQFFAGAIVVILGLYLMLGGPMIGYFYIQSDHWLKRLIWYLSMLLLMSSSLACMLHFSWHLLAVIIYCLTLSSIVTSILGYKQFNKKE